MELIYILALPVLCAVISSIRTKHTFLSALITIIGLSIAFIESVRVGLIASTGVEVVAIEGWLSCDALGALLLLLIAFVGMTSAIFSWGFTRKVIAQDRPERVRRYYRRFNLFIFSMLAVPVLSQIALVWIAVELTTLLSVFLVTFPNTSEAFEAAWKFAVLTCMGAGLALFGILVLYWGVTVAGAETFTWSGLVEVAPKIPPTLLQAAFLFILIGFGTKAGLAPLHTWLPGVYSQTPSPICALMSGVETSTALYAIIRLAPAVHGVQGGFSKQWMLIFGLISVGLAAFLLIQVKEYKRLFAFSTIEHMGIILVAVGLSGPAAYFGACYQLLGHAITKSFCFFAAGATLRLTGKREIDSVRGLIRKSPFVGVSLLLGALAISGAPPFVVFMSELVILKSGLSSGQYFSIGLLALFVVIAFCAIMFHISKMVFGTLTDHSDTALLPRSYAIGIGIAAIPVCFFGLYIPEPLLNLLHQAAILLGR
ncbi:MAG: proton-conducting transporter membrane subunit [Deltaproteobacteria bacterium]|nr:proton-conducting transporter membrane subunit [Deltaproteobacteria bacterium]